MLIELLVLKQFDELNYDAVKNIMIKTKGSVVLLFCAFTLKTLLALPSFQAKGY